MSKSADLQILVRADDAVQEVVDVDEDANVLDAEIGGKWCQNSGPISPYQVDQMSLK